MSNTQQPEALNLEEFRAKVTSAAREPLLSRIAELEAQLSAIGAGGVEAPAAPVSTYVEVRECSDCGHVGINDADGSKAACNTCDWQGDSPREDKCPGCNRVGTMSAACPKCGSRTLLLAETHLLAAAPQAVQAAVPVGGQSRFKGEKDWQWCSAEHVAMVLATPSEWQNYEVRYVYAHPAEGAPAQVVELEVDDLIDRLLNAQGLRDGGASPSANAGEPVAWLVCTEEGDPDMVFLDRLEACQYCEDDDPPKPLYLAALTAQAISAESAGATEMENLQRTAVGWQERALRAERNWVVCRRWAIAGGAPVEKLGDDPDQPFHAASPAIEGESNV